MLSANNLERCTDGYDRGTKVPVDQLVLRMSELKSYVLRNIRPIHHGPEDTHYFNDRISILCGLRSVGKTRRTLKIILGPDVEILYILARTSNISSVTVESLCTSVLKMIYSTVELKLVNVYCSGQIIVPHGTSFDKGEMERSGWFHYYSCKTCESSHFNPHQLDFLHLFPNALDCYDFYFRDTCCSPESGLGSLRLKLPVFEPVPHPKTLSSRAMDFSTSLRRLVMTA